MTSPLPSNLYSVDALPFSHHPSFFPVIYSALHGAGANAVPAVLDRLGFSPVCIQQDPDGAFGGLETPNPEEPVVYIKALAEAEKTNAKLILATDPDCDRVGVMVKVNKGYELLNGNQIGALLIDYIASLAKLQKNTDVSFPAGRSKEPNKSSYVVISTIVSGILGELVSKDYGLEFVRLLTGFKYIGEHIVNLPQERKFFFGYEESYGFLAGDGARDKDAVIASALIVKMAAFYDTKGKTLVDRLDELHEIYGYCRESLHSIIIPQEDQKIIMKKLRAGITFKGLVKTEDYLPGINGLPSADVIKMYFKEETGGSTINAWAAVRPSGTEPKLKLYTCVHAETHKAAKEYLKNLTDQLLEILEVKT